MPFCRIDGITSNVYWDNRTIGFSRLKVITRDRCLAVQLPKALIRAKRGHSVEMVYKTVNIVTIEPRSWSHDSTRSEFGHVPALGAAVFTRD
jgi:hypothetical protein